MLCGVHWPFRLALIHMLACVASLCGGCEQLLALDGFEVSAGAAGSAARVAECMSDADCNLGTGEHPACDQGAGCVSTLGDYCVEVVGPLEDAAAIRIGAIFSLRGPQATLDRERARSAQLAVEQINARGGVVVGHGSGAGSGAHPLALITCDAADDPTLAGRHLIDDLAVSALIGPSGSDDVLQFTAQLAVPKHVLSLSPTASSSSLAALADDDLSWLMLPTDEQRAPLMIQQLQALEEVLGARSNAPLKLSVIYRNDSLGRGTRLSLSGLTLQGAPVFQALGGSTHTRVDVYDPSSSDLKGVVDAQLDFAPDIIILAGGVEAVADFMSPFEERLHADTQTDTIEARSVRPHYMLTDAAKLPELLALAERVPDLGERVSGVGVAPKDSAASDAFAASYRARFAGNKPDVTALASAYDAVYALTYAWAVADSKGAVDATSLAGGLRALHRTGAHTVATGPDDLATALSTLSEKGELSAQGVLAPLDWDERGVPSSGVVAVWCIGSGEAGTRFERSGIELDIASDELRGAGLGCDRAHLSQQVRGDAPLGAGGTGPEVAGVSDDAGSSPASGGGADESASEPAAVGVNEPPAPAMEPDRPELFVESRTSRAGEGDNTIDPGLRVGNRGTGPGVPLGSLKLRYYITSEKSPLCLGGCVTGVYWAGLLPLGETLSASVTYEPTGWLTGYLEITFSQDSPWLRPGDLAEVLPYFHLSDYSGIDEKNDYSFEAAHSQYAETQRVVVFRDDKRVWGEPPE